MTSSPVRSNVADDSEPAGAFSPVGAKANVFTGDLRRVARGGTALDPDVVEILVSRARMLGGGVEQLTPRQREVLALMAEGRSNSWIAAALGCSDKAVVQHTSRIYDTLGLPVDADDHRRVRAVLHYLTE
ncbi:response regulator transcription factor [Microbacterium sp. C7(2022)]|uniref:response regulator transcription factor n=1 Tax=Microbacterium sp. C7(2022) TaxID=2992759 RepID=UPI00237A30C4|nr:LuxR C-terminal-related transcriptional regulator [Microbacterium sp. C7(2022)]MDE0545220.1 LuxR C-terminal-related transcriptional regulator [Microbacterium sp. C7(2022)]